MRLRKPSLPKIKVSRKIVPEGPKSLAFSTKLETIPAPPKKKKRLGI
jgi:hypothetical protein